MPRKRSSNSQESMLTKARQNPLATYPRVFFDIVEAFSKGKPIDPIVCMDEKQATNIRHRFHTFRRLALLQPEAVPGIAASPGIYVRLEGNRVLFMGLPSQLAPSPEELADAVTQVPVGQRPGTEHRSMVMSKDSPQDAGERATEAWLHSPIDPASDRPQASPQADAGLDIPALDVSSTGEPTPPCPPHEPSELNPLQCAKCGKPISDG